MRKLTKRLSMAFVMAVLILSFIVSFMMFPSKIYSDTLSIGDSYGGGIVAYILQSGDPGYDPAMQKGLIAATADISIAYADLWPNPPPDYTYRWSTGQKNETPPNGAYQLVGGTSTDIGQGSSNTDKILAKYSAEIFPYTAAARARAYNDGGYDDWFLPSKDELELMYVSRELIGGFTSGIYWSSTEYDSEQVIIYSFGGAAFLGQKDEGHRVRAIRYFSVSLAADSPDLGGSSTEMMTVFTVVPGPVRTHEMTCWQIYVNEEGNFEFIFWWEYGNNNWVSIYDTQGNLVYREDFPYGNPVVEVDLPDGMYTVKTFHEEGNILQEFIIGKP